MIQKIKKLYFLRSSFYTYRQSAQSEDILNYSTINYRLWLLLLENLIIFALDFCAPKPRPQLKFDRKTVIVTNKLF